MTFIQDFIDFIMGIINMITNFVAEIRSRNDEK